MPSRSSKSSQSTRRSSQVRPPLPGEVNAMMVDVMPTPHQPYHLQTLSTRDRTIPLLRDLEVLEYDVVTLPLPVEAMIHVSNHIACVRTHLLQIFEGQTDLSPLQMTPTPQQSNDLQDAVQLAARVVFDEIKSPAPSLRGDCTWGGGGVGQAAADGLYDRDGERGKIGVLWLARAV
ncbi:hypothetical protein JB92DRAFT_2838631 [Gautieria morchelliformis]|nr:hypothetical protein JB92DRAFT_2838631 [Gautieria morchelliformis]